MADTCVNHPGREGVDDYEGQSYCEQCVDGQETARRKVDRHVDPKECFITYVGRDRWASFTELSRSNTGCAHWVAHQKGISGGSYSCLAGCPIRVKDVIKGRRIVPDVKAVKKGDIWVQSDLRHCGMVTKVVPAKDGDPKIEITHDSSRQGKVVKNDFATFFGGEGDFYR